jgi:SAM-dependent methyltransferase
VKCQICQNTEKNQKYLVKEMMFGTGEEFEYIECGRCGCLQIAEQPKDMAKYYPTNYYEPEEKAYQQSNAVGSRLPKLILNTGLLLGSRIGIILARLYNGPELLIPIVRTHAQFNSEILEVGCGKGVLMATLENWGFKNITGADLYACGRVNDKLQICKTTVDSFSQESFDLIIFDHSFEHMPDQLQTLVKVFEILSNQGICLIRIPVKSDYIWKRYGVNWAQIDAPRHFFIHTLKSIELLAKKAGLEIVKIVFDSTSFQFWASEQYLKNIPLKHRSSFTENNLGTFTRSQIREFDKLAQKLNSDRQGDQAQFYLRKLRKT